MSPLHQATKNLYRWPDRPTRITTAELAKSNSITCSRGSCGIDLSDNINLLLTEINIDLQGRENSLEFGA